MSQSIVNCVEKLDLKVISDRATSENSLTDRQSSIGLELYRQFMALKVMYPNEALIPPKLVDLFWHEHMLNSKKYHADCHELCGNYIHHTPFTEEDHAAWNKTKELYKTVFNTEIDTLNWDDNLTAAPCH